MAGFAGSRYRGLELSYWVAVVARNASATIKSTLDSILSQTLQPQQVIVVDDGSTDATGKTLADYSHAKPERIRIVTLPDRGYDIRRVPANINLASRAANAARLAWDFFMISGDDCKYPVGYAQSLVQRMFKEEQMVVASGRPLSDGPTIQEHTPSGSGRMIRRTYWEDIGGGYPVRAGWETWLLYKAEEMGLSVKLFDDLVYDHARRRGAKHQFVYWGAAMQTLGYHPLYAMGRITKNAMLGSVTPKGSLNLFRGYLQACLGSADSFITPFDPLLRNYIRTSQAHRMMHIIRSLSYA
jgi:hypothetical protein